MPLYTAVSYATRVQKSQSCTNPQARLLRLPAGEATKVPRTVLCATSDADPVDFLTASSMANGQDFLSALWTKYEAAAAGTAPKA